MPIYYEFGLLKKNSSCLQRNYKPIYSSIHLSDTYLLSINTIQAKQYVQSMMATVQKCFFGGVTKYSLACCGF